MGGMNDKTVEKDGEGERQVRELLKCLQGGESGESCSDTRGRGPAGKSIS